MQTQTDRRIDVVRRCALAYEPEGKRRGHAHIGFEDYPPGAPGRLDFDPLRLFAHGLMRPGVGFDMHPHQNVDSLLIVRGGQCRHRDSLGGDHILRTGDVVGMSAGRGIEHAEHVFGDETLDVVGILLRADRRDTPPRTNMQRGRLGRQRGWTTLAAGPEHHADGLLLSSDARVSTARVGAGQHATHWLEAGRRAYLAIFGGHAEVDGHPICDGDRVQVHGGGAVRLRAEDDVEVFVVDVV